MKFIISYNRNSEFLGYNLLNCVFIFNAREWLISFWIGNLLRGGIRLPSKYFGWFNLWIRNKQILDSKDRGYDNISERFPTKPVEFVGWIKGHYDDKNTLLELGVTGKMIWNRNGHFSHCRITMIEAKELRYHYPDFSPTVFTAIDKDGNQTIHQPLWKGIYED